MTLNEINRSSKYIYFKCSNCGFNTTQDIKSEIVPYADYSDYNIGSDTYINDREARVKEATSIMKYKFSIVGAQPGKFLDIGCSEGFYVEAAVGLGWNAYGLEVPGTRVEHAKSLGLQIQSFDDYQLNNDSYDFILIRHVIEHVPNFIDILVSAVHQLKVGGFICIETPNQAGFISSLRKSKLIDDRFLGQLYPPTHINAFTPKTYRFIERKINAKVFKIITYSPADDSWFFQSNYHEASYKKIIHKTMAMAGLGESICAIYKK